MGLSSANYRQLRKRSNEHLAPIWPSYDDLDKAKKRYRPHVDVSPRPNLEVKVSLQAVFQFQIEGIFEDPYVKELFLRFSRDPNNKFSCVGKLGADGTGGLVVYFGHDDEGSSLFASTFALIGLNVSNGDAYFPLYRNQRVNASSSHSYLRLKYEKELKEISQLERDRLLAEIATLEPVWIEGVPIELDALAVLNDGKLKAQWSDVNMDSCYTCEADSKELAEKWLPKFSNNPIDRIRLGLSPLHALLRSFAWFVKGCTYRDLEKYNAVGISEKAKVKVRLVQMEVCFAFQNNTRCPSKF